MSKVIISLVGNFYRHLAIFFWSHCIESKRRKAILSSSWQTPTIQQFDAKAAGIKSLENSLLGPKIVKSGILPISTNTAWKCLTKYRGTIFFFRVFLHFFRRRRKEKWVGDKTNGYLIEIKDWILCFQNNLQTDSENLFCHTFDRLGFYCIVPNPILLKTLG